MLPTNPLCKTALATSNYPFYNWFGNLLSLVAGQHQTIPDGKLCGPDSKFADFNTPSSDWPTTPLVSGSTIAVQYSAVVPHPGKFMQYITKDGWDQTKPLGWSDLEATPFDTAVNPPIRPGGPAGPEYYWNAKLPTKSGRHIIFSVWERSDSPESFYNCADVDFGGGTGTPTPDPDAHADRHAGTGRRHDRTDAPAQPSLVAATGTAAQLSWAASTDASGVKSYTVHNAATNAHPRHDHQPRGLRLRPDAGDRVLGLRARARPLREHLGKSPTLTFSSGSAPGGGLRGEVRRVELLERRVRRAGQRLQRLHDADQLVAAGVDVHQGREADAGVELRGHPERHRRSPRRTPPGTGPSRTTAP